MTSIERTLVLARETEERAGWQRIDASTPELAHAALELADDVSAVCAVVSPADDRDAFVALVSVLVMCGVVAFETTDPTIVQRILDAHSAVAAGHIEVLS